MKSRGILPLGLAWYAACFSLPRPVIARCPSAPQAGIGAIANGLQGAAVGAAVGGGVGLVMAGAMLKGSWKDVKIKKRRWTLVHLDQDVHIPAARPSKP